MSRIINGHYAFVFQCESITDTGDGQDDGKIIFPFYPFLDDLKMKKAEKSTAKALSQGNRRIFLIDEGGVIQFIFLEGDGQVFIVLWSDRIDGGKYHRFEFLEPGQGFVTGSLIIG